MAEAPVFRPSDEEWRDPIAYISSIRAEAEPFGCCKIVPPPSFHLPFALDRENVRVRLRQQSVEKLCERGQVKESIQSFHDDYARCATQGSVRFLWIGGVHVHFAVHLSLSNFKASVFCCDMMKQVIYMRIWRKLLLFDPFSSFGGPVCKVMSVGPAIGRMSAMRPED